MAVFRGPSVDVINVLQPPSESLPGSQAPNFSKTGDAFVTTHIEHAGDLHTGRLTLIDSPQSTQSTCVYLLFLNKCLTYHGVH